MKNQVNSVCALFAIFIFGFVTQSGFAQDATKVDSTHYKVAFENDQVRVLRISYGPGEKSVMHEHAAGVLVFLTDITGKFTFPDGTTEEITGTAGQTFWAPSVKHLPEYTGDKALEVLLVELKVKPETNKKE